MKKVLLAVAFFTPAVAFAAPQSFAELADTIVTLLDSGTGLLILAGIVIYFYGITQHVWKSKDSVDSQLWQYVLWGIGVIFLMVSIWGILDLIQNTIFGADHFDPATGAPAAQPSFQVTQTFE